MKPPFRRFLDVVLVNAWNRYRKANHRELIMIDREQEDLDADWEGTLLSFTYISHSHFIQICNKRIERRSPLLKNSRHSWTERPVSLQNSFSIAMPKAPSTCRTTWID
jgi:hypothetical protein